jgi:hypothetical protein
MSDQIQNFLLLTVLSLTYSHGRTRVARRNAARMAVTLAAGSVEAALGCATTADSELVWFGANWTASR